MGINTNIGQEAAVSISGNPESSIKLIKSHGQLCQIKQALVCPCVAVNNGSADYLCEICDGDGYLYTYQRRFMVVDENSPTCGNTLSPFWQPILSVKKVQNVTSECQGGIRDIEVESFESDNITLSESLEDYEKKRVTYEFDGWTKVESEKLQVDAVNGLMYANGTIYDAGYQSSNPLQANSDIAKIDKIWNSDTGIEITDYKFEGRTISTKESVFVDKMLINYYYADLTQVLTSDVQTRDNNETFTHELSSGDCKMAFLPFWELSKGDIITIAATVLYKNEAITHVKDIDKLWEMEVIDLNEKIIDIDGNVYDIDIDYKLQGRYIKWLTDNKPKVGKVFTIRYGYKPSYIVFEDNPMPNNLENKIYPIQVLCKSWSKMDKNDIAKLVNI